MQRETPLSRHHLPNIAETGLIVSASRAGRVRFAAASALSVLFALATASPASAAPVVRERAAVVVTQAIGVGTLADRLGNIAADLVAAGPMNAIAPGEAIRLLRAKGGPDPMSCGTERACLADAARVLGVRWLITVGIGSFGQMYSLELGALDLAADAPPATTSATYAAPGPEWEQAVRERLGKVLPPALLAPPSKLVVTSEIHGAELYVDGARIATTPVDGPIVVAAGPRVVELRKDGYLPSRTRVEAVSGSQHPVDLRLLPASSPSHGGSLRTWSYVAGGGAAAALVGAIAFHATASSTMDEARLRKDQGLPFADRRSDALSQVGTARVLYGVAGAALAGAVVLWFLDEPAAATR
ncbi:hypothetical protein AKJ08_2690 [Vulgatibacter incomptus]|uniref:PEGA domain-containing protein n=1 Tax=Vulgatibacter incomptus TaxID=1391653 RepID=A0A0K1PFJ7_9BACT|nr:hypothetical protein AKJ08_2690 [Vulgatibacter incomptus]